MRSQLNRLSGQFWMHLKNYTSNLIKFIRSKRDEDDNHFDNPFVIF